MYRALYSFRSAEPNSLPFAAGETFLLLERSNQHWWLVTRAGSGETGYAPASYLQRLQVGRGRRARGPCGGPCVRARGAARECRTRGCRRRGGCGSGALRVRVPVVLLRRSRGDAAQCGCAAVRARGHSRTGHGDTATRRYAAHGRGTAARRRLVLLPGARLASV